MCGAAVPCGHVRGRRAVPIPVHQPATCTPPAGALLQLGATGGSVSASAAAQAPGAHALAVSRHYVAVGCSDGTVHIFQAASLAFVCSLPPPPAPQAGDACGPAAAHTGAGPACMGLSFNAQEAVLAAAYGDRSVALWGLSELPEVGVRLLQAA